MTRLLLASALCVLALTASFGDPDPAPQPMSEAQKAAKAKRRLLSQHMTSALDHMEAARRLLAPLASEDPPTPDAQRALRAKAKARYGQAAQAYDAAIALLPSVSGAAPERLKLIERIAYYNLACARARLGQADLALTALGKALELGYGDIERVERDPDLSDLRSNPRFVNLLERVQARLAKQAMAAAAAELSSDALFAYDFTIKTLEGKTLSLKDLRGKVVIVDYWGTWCPPCRMEIPHFVELAKRYPKDLVIVGMTWERGQKGPGVVKQVKAFAKKLGATYPMTLLSEQKDLAKVPNLEAFPTTLFLDRKGRVRAREVGYRDLASLEKLVKALAKEPGPAPKKDPKKKTPKPGPF